MHERAEGWGKWVAAGAALVVPAAHPLLRVAIGAPSHLLWFAVTLPVAIVTYAWGLRGAVPAVLAVVAWVGLGESAFGGGYGTSADEATVIALMAAVGFTGTLIAGFSLAARAEHERTRAVQAQLAQSQKMEAIGRLAGGVAHDFNNLLTVILSTAHVLRDDAVPGTQAHDDLDTIVGAANSASDLTRQLLAFSRRQDRVRRVLSINDVVSRIVGMLRRLAGEDVTLAVDLDPAAGHVEVDSGQLEQIVMNLVANSRDAMPTGGRITIATAVQRVAADAVASGAAGALAAGTYAVLDVTDTGTGMDAATRARIFEPFFTTKPPGKGTGLGLATVFGIVRDAGGDVMVSSRPGKGTCIRACFRQVAAPRGESSIAAAAGTPSAASATAVLLVEDQPQVRDATRRMLEALGYAVTTAENGRAALEAFERDPRRFGLIVTDVVMPVMGGLELAERIGQRASATPILFVSGYTPDGQALCSAQNRGCGFLQKPFDAQALGAAVAAAFGNRPNSGVPRTVAVAAATG